MKLAILGAAGRMGRTILQRGAETDGCEWCAAVERPDFPQLGQAVPCSGLRTPLVYTAEWPARAETVIDFTFHASVPGHLGQAVANRQAYVLGTTGLSEAEGQAVREAAQTIPVVWAANMSTGINLLLELVRRSAEILGPDYDIEIVETHHRRKKDAPSGTALALAEAAAAGRGINLGKAVCYGREGIVGERPRGEIGIHAVRGGSVVGDHTVYFLADEERVELTHRASSREAFAKGALRAALWLKGRPAGLYSMRHVLGFETV